MSKFQLQFSLLKYTGLFFVFLTTLTISTFLTPPKNLSLANESVKERQPNSVFSIHNFSNKSLETPKNQEQEFYSVQLDCKSLQQKDNYTISSKGKNIRLKSKCATDSTWLSITNTSNNHSGQVLKVNTHGILTSDFIRLSKGKNQLQLLMKDNDGTVTKKSFSVIY
ncbi:MAG: hypothetical protein MK008_03600 [Bdellovibrionales bacterium]|nr:hypothetical protein [Bdellovibrionales bacterium]